MRTKIFPVLVSCLATFSLIVGCGTVSVPNAAYNAENFIADGAIAATHVFNQYAQTKETNGPIASIECTRATLYATDVQISASLKLADELRLEMATNSASTNGPLLNSTLQNVEVLSSNVMTTVQAFTNSPPSTP